MSMTDTDRKSPGLIQRPALAVKTGPVDENPLLLDVDDLASLPAESLVNYVRSIPVEDAEQLWRAAELVGRMHETRRQVALDCAQMIRDTITTAAQRDDGPAAAR